jgi:hypothetical protein
MQHYNYLPKHSDSECIKKSLPKHRYLASRTSSALCDLLHRPVRADRIYATHGINALIEAEYSIPCAWHEHKSVFAYGRVPKSLL